MNAPDSLDEHVLQVLCGLRMMAKLEALVDKQSKWKDILPELDAVIAQAQSAVKSL